MINERVVETSGVVAEVLESGLDRNLNLVVVFDVLELEVTLLGDGELESGI